MCDGGDLQEIDHFTIRKCVLPRRKPVYTFKIDHLLILKDEVNMYAVLLLISYLKVDDQEFNGDDVT